MLERSLQCVSAATLTGKPLKETVVEYRLPIGQSA